MSIRVAIRHKTHYRYDRPVNMAPHILRLRPAAHSRTPILGYSLRILPEKHFINWQQDPFGNYLARLVFPEKTTHFDIEVEVIADMTVINPFDFFLEEYATEYPFEYDEQLAKELVPYCELSESGPLLMPGWKTWIGPSAHAGFPGRTQPDGLEGAEVQHPHGTRRADLRGNAGTGLRFLPRQRLAAGADSASPGFCRALRVRLSGATHRRPEIARRPVRPGSRFHRSARLGRGLCAGRRLDRPRPTSGLFAGENHIPLACTPDPVSAAPVTGAMDECEVSFSFDNSVVRIHEDPRVTKPYRDDQWTAIDALGRAVDAKLDEYDVRLTMGGEPTFVSIDDMESAQWNTAALGQHKLERAQDLWNRLTKHFAPNGLKFSGQGKWYPGEPLPRWALGIFWRTDGVALWKNPELLADEGKSYGHTTAMAAEFSAKLSAKLGLSPTSRRPAMKTRCITC
jgi:hypothetical protein